MFWKANVPCQKTILCLDNSTWLEKSTIENAVDEKIKWLDSNPDASVEEMKSQKKSLEEVVNPIISKIYKNNGSASPPEMEDNGSERTEL